MEANNDICPHFKAEKYLWFRAKLEIDMMDIDEEIIVMGALVQDCGECCATANENRERAKEHLDVTKAQVSQHLRESPVTAGATRRSETQIESQLALFQPFVDAREALSRARLDAALWTTMVEGLRAKLAMIRVSADLLNSGFITPDFIRNKRRKQIREAPVKVDA
jgi:hypothetical protein